MIDFAALASTFLAAQLAGDRERAWRVVADAHASGGAQVVELQSRVIRAAQAEIGRLWQANRVTVAQEHLATGISQLVMARLFELAPRAPRNGKTVALACVDGEQHDFPSRLVADYLEHAGYTVRYYGASLPTDDLVNMLAAEKPDLVAISVTMTFHIGALREAVRRIRERLPDLPIVIGGRALEWSPSLAADLGVATAPAEHDALVAGVDALLGVAA